MTQKLRHNFNNKNDHFFKSKKKEQNDKKTMELIRGKQGIIIAKSIMLLQTLQLIEY